MERKKNSEFLLPAAMWPTSSGSYGSTRRLWAGIISSFRAFLFLGICVRVRKVTSTLREQASRQQESWGSSQVHKDQYWGTLGHKTSFSKLRRLSTIQSMRSDWNRMSYLNRVIHCNPRIWEDEAGGWLWARPVRYEVRPCLKALPNAEGTSEFKVLEHP